MKTKHTEITVETARVIVVSKPKRLIARCEDVSAPDRQGYGL